MRFSTAITTLLASVAAVSAVPFQKRQAQTFTVMVGQNGTLTYNPSNVTGAKIGDTIQFQFVSKNHTVTQSTFADPCVTMSTPAAGIDSGYMFVETNATQFPAWSFTLNNDSTPLWFYCKQTGHCGKGMVFAVNPTAAKSFDAFQQTAMQLNGTATAGAAGNASASAGTAASTGGATAAASGTAAAASASGSAAAAGAASTSAGFRASGSAAGLLTVVGLVAGLLL